MAQEVIQQYYALITNIGAAKMLNAALRNQESKWVTLVIGDGNGDNYGPTSAQTELRNKVDSIPITGIKATLNSGVTTLHVEALIPAKSGPYDISEGLILDGDGDPVVVLNYPRTPKVTIEQGAVNDVRLSVVVSSGNAHTVSLKFDPAIAAASRKYVDEQIAGHRHLRNLFINGNMALWRSGLVFSAVDTIEVYGPDNWQITPNAPGGALTVSRGEFVRGQTDVPHAPRYFASISVTALSATGRPAFAQCIENVESMHGKTAWTLMWLRSDKPLVCKIIATQRFGGGSSNVNTDSDNFTVNGDMQWRPYYIATDLPPVTGKIFGDGGDCLRMALSMPDNDTYNVDCCLFHTEPTDFGATYDDRRWELDYLLACRTLNMTYGPAFYPGERDLANAIGGVALSSAPNSLAIQYRHARMRARPTIAIYHDLSGAANVLHGYNGSTASPDLYARGTDGVTITNIGPIIAGQFYACHAVASAHL